MTEQHPITPPPELVEEWANASARTYRENGTYAQHEFALATQAARWGADQELEACCAWCADGSMVLGQELRAARRPKSPSLKEQALAVIENYPGIWALLNYDDEAILRRALEQLDD